VLGVMAPVVAAEAGGVKPVRRPNPQIAVGHALLTKHLGALFLLVALLSVFAFLSLFLAGLFIWASSAIDAWQSAVAIGAGDDERAASRRMFRL
jgi:hypothetical protein